MSGLPQTTRISPEPDRPRKFSFLLRPFFLDFGPGIPKGNDTIKHFFLNIRVDGIDIKVSKSFKLISASRGCSRKARLKFAGSEPFERIGIYLKPGAFFIFIRIFLCKKMIIQAT